MRPRRSLLVRRGTNVTLVGLVVLAVSAVGMWLAYNAGRGVPVTPRYEVAAEVPDAAQLTESVSEVRIGGSRVGVVKDVRAMPARGGRPPYARLTLALDRALEPLPADTAVQVRPRSILGAKYLDLTPGRSGRGVPDGGTLAQRRARPAFEFDDAFRIFDAETRAGMRRATRGLGDGLAGRGTDLNTTIPALRSLLPRAQRVAATLAAPETGLSGAIGGAAATMGALAPVADRLGSLVDGTATTLAALDAAGDDVGRTLDELPPTEAAATRTLAAARPVVDDAAALARGLADATPLLVRTSGRLTQALDAGTPLLTDVRRARVVPGLGRAVDALRAVVLHPSTRPALSGLHTAVTTLQRTLNLLVPAQLRCNVGGLFARNVSEVVNQGDTSGNWLNVLVIFDLDVTKLGASDQPSNLTTQSGDPAPHLHFNPYPVMDERECEAGNEPYSSGQRIGNVPGLQPASTEDTRWGGGP